MNIKLIILTALFLTSNFTYQFMQDVPNYTDALNVSLYQAVAIIIFCYLQKMTRKDK